jgi:hypothetical protein
VSLESGQPAFFRPPPVTVHDDGDMAGQTALFLCIWCPVFHLISWQAWPAFGLDLPQFGLLILPYLVGVGGKNIGYLLQLVQGALELVL